MSDGKIVGRRALIASAAALTAGLIAKQSAQPVAAASTMLTDTINQATTTTGITTTGAVGFQAESTAASGAGLAGFNSTGVSGIGARGLSNYIGAQGAVGFLSAPITAQYTIGVQGVNAAIGGNETGVQGLIDSPPSGGLNTGPSSIGVEGRNNSSGSGSIGVLGTIGPYPGGNPPSSTAVGALNLSTATNTFGMTAQIYGTSGVAILGSSNGPSGGIQGQSTGGHGLVGTTDATDGHGGLIGNANNQGGVGLIGIAPGYGTGTVGKAAIFYGNIHITGGTIVAPVMQAVVKHAGDNSYRILYTEASTESWCVDYGEGQLAGDRAEIKLDPDFAALVDTSTLHVFLTPHTPQHLHVPARTATGFSVVATASGATGAGGPKRPDGMGTFSYRVVAKRKDITSERLAKVGPPTAPKAPKAYEISVPEQYQAMHRTALAAARNR